MTEYLLMRGPYLLVVFLLVLGVYILAVQRNLLQSMVGLYLFQSGIILFFILLAVRQGASIPILDETRLATLHNPLPHALMLTAIVVGVATFGLGVALLRRIQAEAGAIDDFAEGGES